jgi:hypothetical protein
MGWGRGIAYVDLPAPKVGPFPAARQASRELEQVRAILDAVERRWKAEHFVSTVTDPFAAEIDSQMVGPEPERSELAYRYRKVIRLGAMVSLLEAEAELALAGKAARPYWNAMGVLLAMLKDQLSVGTPGAGAFLIQAGYHLARHGPDIGPELSHDFLRGVGAT